MGRGQFGGWGQPAVSGDGPIGSLAGRGGYVHVVRVLDGRRVVLGHLDGDVTGDVRGAAPTVPGLRVQELA